MKLSTLENKLMFSYIKEKLNRWTTVSFDCGKIFRSGKDNRNVVRTGKWRNIENIWRSKVFDRTSNRSYTCMERVPG